MCCLWVCVFSFLLVFQLALAVTNPLPLFAYVDTLTGGDTCESLTYSPRTPRLPPATLPRLVLATRTLSLKSPYHITCCRAFLCCWPVAKFLIFGASCQLRVARCQLRIALPTNRTTHSFQFSFSIYRSTKRIFILFCWSFFFALSALYKFVSGSSLDEDDDTRDSCQLSSAKILTVIMRHMQITLSEA